MLETTPTAGEAAKPAPDKIGAYLCQGCGLGERLDIDRLAQLATEGGAEITRQHAYLCSADGVAAIRDDIEQGGVTHVVIGACSRRAKTEAFDFEDVAVARANLREGVIWSQPDSAEHAAVTQDMADDYIRMGCVEAKFMRVPQPSAERGGNKRILVVGGGVSGLTAALASAGAGYEVLLVEKSAALGGWARFFHRRMPRREPYAQPEPNDLAALIARVEKETGITVFLKAKVARTSGAPGQFTVDIATASGATGGATDAATIATENIGAIVQASGFSRYDAAQLPEFAYGKTPDVVDQTELEALASAAAAENVAIARPSDGSEVRSVVFVQCAGQRSEKPGHLPYCSGYCCGVSIKQAMYFKAQNPAIEVNIIYTDLRAPGNLEDFYRAAQDMGVAFTNGVVSGVEVATGGLVVHFHDAILDEDAAVAADLVVLATGQVPNSGVDISAPADAVDSAKPSADSAESAKSAADSAKSTADSVKSSADSADSADSTKTSADSPNPPAARGQAMVSVESILNLDYRQGADMPHLKHGFSDSHFICFPYESRRTGIYACGPVRRPMDIQQSIEDATGAAMKAIQAVEGASMGRAAHPRSGDLSYPSFRREGCTQCKRCTVECPFGAIDEDEAGYPVFNESRCRRCGTCMGACPVRVISFDNYSVDTVGQQIKAVDMPDEFDEKPRILVLACENDAYPALDMAAHNRIPYNAFVRVLPVRCLGSVNLIWVTDALSAGFDGIMMMGCKKGDDYQCHFVTGSALAHERMSKIDDTLNQLQLEPERVQTYEVEITDIMRAPQLINDYAAKIDEIGMNPFKGF